VLASRPNLAILAVPIAIVAISGAAGCGGSDDSKRSKPGSLNLSAARAERAYAARFGELQRADFRRVTAAVTRRKQVRQQYVNGLAALVASAGTAAPVVREIELQTVQAQTAQALYQAALARQASGNAKSGQRATAEARKQAGATVDHLRAADAAATKLDDEARAGSPDAQRAVTTYGSLYHTFVTSEDGIVAAETRRQTGIVVELRGTPRPPSLDPVYLRQVDSLAKRTALAASFERALRALDRATAVKLAVEQSAAERAYRADTAAVNARLAQLR
jgi:hypothetical protein